jgi:hypothetical protein
MRQSVLLISFRDRSNLTIVSVIAMLVLIRQ